MDENREFKIDLHAKDPDDDDLNRTVAFDKQAKPSAKASILFVVVALIIFGGILFFLYYNLNSKIQTINTRGSAGIDSLSNEFNTKLSDFLQQFATQTQTFQARLSDLDTQLKKLNASVSTIQTSKVDKKDLVETIQEIKKDFSPLQESIIALNEQVSGIKNEAKRMDVNLNKIQTGVLNNKKEISTLDAIHIDQVYFDQEMKKEREFNQQNMAHASETLFSEMAMLHQRIKDLEKKLGYAANIPSSKKSNATKSPSEDISVPKPGEIIEQEIK